MSDKSNPQNAKMSGITGGNPQWNPSKLVPSNRWSPFRFSVNRWRMEVPQGKIWPPKTMEFPTNHTVDGPAKSGYHQLIDGKHPILHRVSTIQGGAGFRNHPHYGCFPITCSPNNIKNQSLFPQEMIRNVDRLITLQCHWAWLAGKPPN